METPVISNWSEENSETFLNTGAYFVPRRSEQIETILALLPLENPPALVMELCCGEGLLAAAILERFPHAHVAALDGSPTMLAKARENLSRFGDRFTLLHFDLMADDWRTVQQPLQAVVSSLAIHHLDDQEKQCLFQHIYHMLAPGGALVIADLIQPVSRRGQCMAAVAYDNIVKEQASMIDKSESLFEYFQQTQWNFFRYPDPVDMPSRLPDQLLWLTQAGFTDVDVYWLFSGHAIYGGVRPEKENQA